MRSMGTRRAALFAGAATVAAVALTGCGSGQQAETANKEPSIYGVNLQNADQSVLIRNLAVTYATVKGYPSGANAPLELALFNETRQPVTVSITSDTPTTPPPGVITAESVRLGGASSTPVPSGIPSAAEPSGSRPAAQQGGPGQATPDSGEQMGTAGPSAPATPTLAPTASGGPTRPAEITIAALDSVSFRPGGVQSLQLIGLKDKLVPGQSVSLTFSFSNGAPPLTVAAPVGVPLSPAPRGSAENEGLSEEEGH